MLSLPVRPQLEAGPIEAAVLEGLPESVFGNDEWASTVTTRLVKRLLDAVESGQVSQFVNGIRLAAHVPSAHDVRMIANSVCDAAVTYATISGHKSEQFFTSVSQFRKGANDILDRSIELLPHPSTPKAAITACDTLLQLVAVSRPELHKHIGAVSSLSVRIGRQLEVEDEIVESIRLGALLHDVGLLTTGTDSALAERDPAHATLGDRCLAGIESLRDLAPIVRSHHEHYDGTGRPDGLRGAEIPIEARIIAVADAFEHLANRAARSNPIAQAISELWQESGTVYDPDVVAAITRLFNQHWHIRRKASGAL
jgi:HD-GYP domain-containing protein (c-di-GMP phosphodiesterase class II)